MTVHPALKRDSSNFADWVDDTLRILRGRGDQHDGLVVDRPCHRSRIGTPVVAHRHAAHFHTEVGAGFLEGCVGGGGQHHIGASFVVTKLIAGRLHRHQDALGATAGEEPTR